MKENILEAAVAADAEAWVLPEVGGCHVVGTNSASSGRAHSASGFSSGPKDASEPVRQRHNLRAMTQSQLEALEAELREIAEREGRAQGYETGYREGEQRANEVIEERAQQERATLSAMIDSLFCPLGDALNDYRRLMVELVIEAASTVCERELQADNSTIATVVASAIEAIPMGEQHVELQLHPRDLAVVQRIPGLLQPHWRIESNPDIALGGCRIASEHSTLDYTRSARLQQILQQGLLEVGVADSSASEYSDTDNDKITGDAEGPSDDTSS